VASPGVPAPPRWIARYTVARLTENSSASSSVLCSPPARLDQGRFLRGLELGRLPAQSALGLRNGDPFAGAGPGEVGLELGDHRQHGEQQPADRIGGVVDRAADVEPDATVSEFVDDVAGVWHRTGEAIEFGDDQGGAFRQAARASRSPGRSRFVPVRPWST
jgi:hypothetical protein